VNTLRSVPGVGVKLAERIIVELRDRVVELADVEREPGAGTRPAPARDEGRRGELISALVNLQAPRPKAERVADEVFVELGAEAPIEELVRAALQRLAR